MSREEGSGEVVVVDVPERDRFEARVGGELAAVAEYSRAPRFLVFSHTQVFPGHEGRGTASTLVRRALDDLRGRGLQAVPLCPFVAGWIARHPDYADVVFRAARGPAEGD